MVVFTCNHCGETLQKPRVAKHYQFQCRRGPPFLTCVDCFKDFREEEYISHTKCITEAERYGGKDYVPKASANKGEKKQKEWLNVVNNLLKSTTNLSNVERSFLQVLSKYENVPRKKVKFLNFVNTALSNRFNKNVVESVWSKMEEAQKNNTPNSTENKQQNGQAKPKEEERTTIAGDMQESVNDTSSIENQNNQNIETEKQKQSENNNGEHANGYIEEVESKPSKKEKKSKKRKNTEPTEEEAPESVTEKKKKKVFVPTESHDNEIEKTTESTSFDWKSVILNIVQKKGELSLKKLQKKVVTQYMEHCSNTVTQEKAGIKFNKKLKKMPQVVILEDRVKLA